MEALHEYLSCAAAPVAAIAAVARRRAACIMRAKVPAGCSSAPRQPPLHTSPWSRKSAPCRLEPRVCHLQRRPHPAAGAARQAGLGGGGRPAPRNHGSTYSGSWWTGCGGSVAEGGLLAEERFENNSPRRHLHDERSVVGGGGARRRARGSTPGEGWADSVRFRRGCRRRVRWPDGARSPQCGPRRRRWGVGDHRPGQWHG